MSLQALAETLRTTIKGKESYLANLKNPDDMFNMEARMVVIATRSFLEINIDELKLILKDVENILEKA